MLADAGFRIDDGLELGDEPGVDLRVLVDFLFGHAHAQRLGDHAQAIRRRRADSGADRVLGAFALFVTGNFDFIETGKAGFETAQRLLQGFRKGAADGHDFTDRLHRGGEDRRRARELLEGETRDLGDDVVNRGFERCRGGAAGDVVFEFVQSIADGELRGDLGDREAGCLGSQRRGARHARVHFDDDEAAVLRVDGELHVGAAGLDADLTQHRNRGVAHDLVFLVGQRQRWRDSDGVTGMDAHRIDVFDGADDDAIVRGVADDFHLILLPAQNRFFDQNFRRRRGVEAAGDDVEEFRAVIGNAAARAAQRKRRADDGGQADMIDGLGGNGHGVGHVTLLAVGFAEVPLVFEVVQRLVEFGAGELALQLRPRSFMLLAVGILDFRGVGEHRARGFKADAGHGFAEEGPVFGHVDGFGLRADHFDIVAVENAHALERKRGVERGLAAHGRQQRVGTLLGDDLGDNLRGDRLDVGGVRETRIGHDRRRVGVDQNDPVTFLLQRLTGLRAGVIEFTCLTDNDRSRADDEDGLDILALRHGLSRSAFRLRKTPARVEDHRPGSAIQMFSG